MASGDTPLYHSELPGVHDEVTQIVQTPFHFMALIVQRRPGHSLIEHLIHVKCLHMAGEIFTFHLGGC